MWYFSKSTQASLILQAPTPDEETGLVEPGQVLKYSAYKNLASVAEAVGDLERATDAYLEVHKVPALPFCLADYNSRTTNSYFVVTVNVDGVSRCVRLLPTSGSRKGQKFTSNFLNIFFEPVDKPFLTNQALFCALPPPTFLKSCGHFLFSPKIHQKFQMDLPRSVEHVWSGKYPCIYQYFLLIYSILHNKISV